MGVTDALTRLAARHAHVLLVDTPGHWRTRAAVERAVLARGWILATSPADADVLAVCGSPGPRLGQAVEAVWDQVPGPRVRVQVDGDDPGDVEARLARAYEALLDTSHHREDARTRSDASPAALVPDDGEDHGEDHGEMAPGGIPLAGGAPDRDGLEMDVLTLRLGPVLAYWPAGLVLRCVLHGDVIAEASAEVLDPRGETGAGTASDPARTLDNVVSLLALAGWDDAAVAGRRVRDAVLTGTDDDTVPAQLERLRRRVRRSRSLRWSLRGIRPLDPERLAQLGLPAHLGGDTHARLLGMLERAGRYSDRDPGGRTAGDVVGLETLPHLVGGLDLATARLVVASLDLQELTAARVPREVTHG